MKVARLMQRAKSQLGYKYRGGPYWMKNLIGYQIFLKRFCAKAFKGRFDARRPTLLSWKKKENVT